MGSEKRFRQDEAARGRLAPTGDSLAPHSFPGQFSGPLLSQFLDAVGSGIMVTDPRQLGNPITFVSGTFEELTGYRAADVVGRDWSCLHGPGTDRLQVAQIAEAVANGQPVECDILSYRCGSEPFWNHLRIRPLHDDQRNVTCLVWTLTDVTQRKHVEQELKTSQERFRSVLAAMPDIIAVVGADGRYRQVFTGEPALLPEPPEQLVGRTIEDVLPPDTAQLVRRVVQQTLTANAVQQVEYSVLRHEQLRWFSARVVPFCLADDPGVLWVARDITEQRRLEASFEDARRLVPLGVLAASIAHEINNPIGAAWMATVAGLAIADPGRSPDTVRECFATIASGLQRCQAIVHNVLKFARHEPSEKRPQDLNLLVQRAVETTRYYAQARQVRFALDLATDLPLVTVNDVEIEQVLVNLIRNAIQAGAGYVSIRTLATAGGVQIVTGDDGCGIPPEHVERIFDPLFSHGHSGENTGLGLVISRSLVTNHHGTIEVSSEVGAGTVFTVTLPLSPSAESPPASPGVQQPTERT